MINKYVVLIPYIGQQVWSVLPWYFKTFLMVVVLPAFFFICLMLWHDSNSQKELQKIHEEIELLNRQISRGVNHDS